MVCRFTQAHSRTGYKQLTWQMMVKNLAFPRAKLGVCAAHPFDRDSLPELHGVAVGRGCALCAPRANPRPWGAPRRAEVLVLVGLHTMVLADDMHRNQHKI